MSYSMENCDLSSSKLDPHCGCLEQEWDTPLGFVSFHLLPSGSGEVFFDNGDCEWEEEIEASSESEFFQKLEAYINNAPYLDN